VLFGVDQESEALARSLAIDDNNFVMGGSDFTAFDIAKMWESEYIGVLTELADQNITPITVDESAIADLLLSLSGESESVEETEEDKDTEIDVDGIELECKCPKCGFEFDPKSA
jgi:hypothetical protein